MLCILYHKIILSLILVFVSNFKLYDNFPLKTKKKKKEEEHEKQSLKPSKFPKKIGRATSAEGPQ